MDGGHLLMSAKERLRKSVFERVVAGQWSLADAAQQLAMSYRQCKRLYSRLRAQGDSGLLHLSRGRPSSRRRPQAFRETVLALCRTEFCSLGPTLAAEKLAERGYVIDHETLRRWLIADGQWRRRRKRGRHRMQRERKAHFGEMLQLDGSHHAWFGPEQPRACLMNLVDDATGVSMSLMAEEETTEAALCVVWKWVEKYGIPRALYLDRKSVYLAQRAPTIEEQLAGETPLTAFGLACKKLGIALITAHSPQAKGRVERKHGVYQDRLVHELRLRGITTIARANALIDAGLDKQLNAKFAHAPRDPADAHLPVCAKVDLRDVFCVDEPRTVANDWTIQHRKQAFQILRLNHPLPRPGDKVVVRTWLDGSVYLWFRQRPLVFANAPIPPQETRKKPNAKKPGAHGPNPKPKPKPAPDHPWKRAFLAPKGPDAKTR